MLQTLPNTAYLRCPTWFQVPKGMLQTQFLSYLLKTPNNGFKSPRECYKHSSKPLRKNQSTITVSSPQGNATNPYAVPRVMGTAIQFQVPKGMLQTLCRLNTCVCTPTWFQVPKGKLQTVYFPIYSPSSTKGFQVPKGMLQTQPVFVNVTVTG